MYQNKHSSMPLVLLLAISMIINASVVYAKSPEYGLNFNNDKIHAAVWSPDAEVIYINVYRDCESQSSLFSKALIKLPYGNWSVSLDDSLIGYTYSFSIQRNGQNSREVVDPFVKSTCANGNRGTFLRTDAIIPEGWEKDKFIERKKYDPLILYELHVRDFSIDPKSGMSNKGKYLAFSEKYSNNAMGKPSGINYIKDLGVTHLHLLPVFDFASIDELSDKPKYNWGYDPQNFFVPEGSYSSIPNNPKSRILEFKEMVKSIHESGLGVIMDVVYNHTYYLENSNYQVWAPGYYYRQNEDGTYSNASACGNELATEREKVRELIIESLKFWMNEYHIDGFRFDLMGIMDIPGMKLITEELEKINPGVVLYGEGWLAGSSPLADSLRAMKANMKKIPGISAFSDEIRDGLKGHWSEEKDKGFVSGKPGMKASVKFGIAGASEHPQIDYSKVNNSDFAWAENPWQCINYVSCHDNHTLIDKLKISAGNYDEALLKKMHLLAQSVVLSAQGIPFLHAGTEFFRTKYGDHNSFESPDSINMIDWSLVSENQESIDYLKALIQFRKTNDAFWSVSKNEVNRKLKFLDGDDSELIVFSLKSDDDERGFNEALFLFAGVGTEESFILPDGQWSLQFTGFAKAENKMLEGKITIQGPEAIILTR
ncbi:type I pullulanase [Hyphobacterium sp. CCMP332]|nr:type I pullulanase [Hyphobacterium sp. CCMP332]